MKPMAREWVRNEWRKTVDRLADGAEDVKREYADRILELIEEGGNDVEVLEEVEVQLKLMVQAGIFELRDVMRERLLEVAKWVLVVLSGRLES